MLYALSSHGPLPGAAALSTNFNHKRGQYNSALRFILLMLLTVIAQQRSLIDAMSREHELKCLKKVEFSADRAVYRKRYAIGQLTMIPTEPNGAPLGPVI